jgi:anti-sigma B factor antagonist
MQMTEETSADGITTIKLSGRLDTAGSQEVELRFSAVTSAHRAVIVDLSGVEFLTSLGIRLLLQGAKTVRSKGGKLALMQPRELVQNVLKTAGVEAMVPVLQGQAAAIAAVSP